MADEQKEALFADLEAAVTKAREDLRPNHQRFAEEYVIDYNGTRSALAAGFAESGAHVEASRMLKMTKVMTLINALQRLGSARRGVSMDEQLWRMQAISNSDISHYVELIEVEVKVKGQKKPTIEHQLRFKTFDKLSKEQTYAIESIKQGRNGIEMKLHGKSWSIDMINKYLGTYEKDNRQKGDALAEGVAILMPDNRRGRVVVDDEQKPEA